VAQTFPARGRGVVIVLLVGAGYAVIGLVFAELAKQGGPAATRAWRLAAWLASGLTFGAHIGIERLRLGSPNATAAFRAALAAALGAFLLAMAANIHSARLGIGTLRLHLALAVWPVITFIPAFVAALAAGAIVRRRAPSA